MLGTFRPFTVALALASLFACRGPSIDDVLGPSKDPTLGPRAEAGAEESLVARLDAQARAALDACTDESASYVLLTDAAVRVAIVADLRVQTATWSAVEALFSARTDVALPDVLAAEGRIDGDVRDEVEALCSAGEELCERALKLEPEGVGALHYLALFRTLRAWAIGAGRALVSGLGARIAGSVDRAAAADSEFERAAPLRLSGRFRAQAPWPYRDLERAIRELEEAEGLAPLAVHALFLGDAYWADGRADDARAAWERAARAVDDYPPETAEIHRLLARARLRASG